MSEPTAPDHPDRTETSRDEAEAADRLRHGSSFGAAATAYAEHRPGYAEAAVRWLLEPVRDRQPARVLRPGGVLAGLWNVDDDRIGWVAGLAEISKRKSSITLTRWRDSAAKSRQEQLLGEHSDLFTAAEVDEFGHGQARTADSLLATIGTHSHLLVMDEAERAALLARTGDFLRSQPETAHGEFTLPMVTVVLRAQRPWDAATTRYERFAGCGLVRRGRAG
jgi:hypothetical protein